MKRVLATFAGSRIGIGFCRRLASAQEPIYLLGADSDPWKLQRADTDEKVLIPPARDPDYFEVLARIVKKYEIDFVWPNYEGEIPLLAGRADELGAALFLPDRETIATCQDKMTSYERFAEAGLPTPASMMIHSEADLKLALMELGPEIWLRATSGTGGNGSLPTSDYKTAKTWIDLNDGWGQFMAAQQLSKNTVTWESIWSNGKLLFAQGRRRLYWEFSSLTFSGVTGIGGAHQWVSDPMVDETSKKAILAVSDRPNGVFSADITFGDDGSPCLTEINVGRFMSGGVIHWISDSVNAPLIAMKAALNELDIEQHEPILNPFPTDGILIHGMDTEPVMTSVDVIEKYVKQLSEHREDTAALARA